MRKHELVQELLAETPTARAPDTEQLPVSVEMDALIEMLFEKEITSEVLEELVLSAKENEAYLLNEQGVIEQVSYLLTCHDPIELMDLALQAKQELEEEEDDD